jgi:hypothetical protein
VARKGHSGLKKGKDQIERPVRWRRYGYLLLIVCEDQKTEPAYFGQFAGQFPEETMFIKTVGAGLDPKGVAERALDEKTNLEIQAGRDVDYVWIVFDIDDAALNSTRFQRFQEAFTIAAENKIHIAWSNEAFELWLLLHLTEVDSRRAMRRQEIYELLESEIQKHAGYEHYEYDHGNPEILAIIRAIGSEADAIQRAERLVAAHTQARREPINANPCTHVHYLILKLQEWIAWYTFDPNDE